MASVYMELAIVSGYKPNKTEAQLYNYKDVLSAPGNGNAVIIPPGTYTVQVGLNIDTGSGKIQATLDPVIDVMEDDANVTWVDWDNGIVSSTTHESVYPPTAIRQVNISGTTEMVLVAHGSSK